MTDDTEGHLGRMVTGIPKGSSRVLQVGSGSVLNGALHCRQHHGDRFRAGGRMFYILHRSNDLEAMLERPC